MFNIKSFFANCHFVNLKLHLACYWMKHYFKKLYLQFLHLWFYLPEVLFYLLIPFFLITDRDASTHYKKGPLCQGVGGYWKELRWSPSDDDQCNYLYSTHCQHINTTIDNISILWCFSLFITFSQYSLFFFFFKVDKFSLLHSSLFGRNVGRNYNENW